MGCPIGRTLGGERENYGRGIKYIHKNKRQTLDPERSLSEVVTSPPHDSDTYQGMVSRLTVTTIDWSAAPETISSKFEQKVKESKKIIFFRGAIFEITFTKEGNFSNSKRALIFYLPLQKYLANWRKIKILTTLIGLINVEFDTNTPKETYLSQGFVEFEIGIAPEQTQFLGNITQSKRKK